MRLNHIGIAASSPSEFKKLLDLLGLRVGHQEEVADQKVMTHFVQLSGPPPALEFLEPTDPTSVIAQFIAKRGPGIHHFALEVDRGALAPLCEKLKQNGIRLIYDAPRSGAHGMKMNFIHPQSACGILIEIMETGDAT